MSELALVYRWKCRTCELSMKDLKEEIRRRYLHNSNAMDFHFSLFKRARRVDFFQCGSLIVSMWDLEVMKVNGSNQKRKNVWAFISRTGSISIIIQLRHQVSNVRSVLNPRDEGRICPKY